MRWTIIWTYILIQTPFIVRTDNSFQYIDNSVQPCDDFYKFACGNFENIHPVPEMYTSWDGFVRLQKEVDEQLKELLEAGRTRGDSKSFTKARQMYASCMDTKSRDKRGIFPMHKVLKNWPSKYNETTTSKIGSNDWQQMAKFVADYGVQFIFKFTIRADILNATRTSIYIETDDFSLPTALLHEPVQVLDNGLSSRTDSEFTEYLVKIMSMLRDFRKSDIEDSDILSAARNINNFMTTLRDSTSLNYGEDTATTYIPSAGTTTLAKLQAWTDEVLVNFADTINWRSYLRTAFRKSGVTLDNDTQIFITNRNQLRNLLIFAHETEKKLLDDFVYSRLATFMAPELSSDLYNISIDFYISRGYVPLDYPSWKYCLHKVLDFPKIGLSFALAQKYRETRIAEGTVQRAKQMIEYLRDAMEELIEQAEWMDESTRNYAIYKLKNILILTGSPDYLRTGVEVDQYYKKLRIFKHDHFGNINRLRSFSQRKNFEELGIPRNRNLWTQSPLIVNAYYNGINNRILFPISTMSEPFFSTNTSSLLDYARIGSVMAHELTHAFDSQGKLLDAEGSMVSWWSQSTASIYTTKTKCFIEQYDQYIVDDYNSIVDGTYTLPENIADNVGLRAAFRAFKNEKNKIFSASENANDRFTTDQEFYLAFASIWCHVGTVESNDKHAPHRYRVLGPIQNMEDFLETWQCERRFESQTDTVRSENVDRGVCILW